MSIDTIDTDASYEDIFSFEQMGALDTLGVEWRGRNVQEIYCDTRNLAIERIRESYQDAIVKNSPNAPHLESLMEYVVETLPENLQDFKVIEEDSNDRLSRYDPVTGTQRILIAAEKKKKHSKHNDTPWWAVALVIVAVVAVVVVVAVCTGNPAAGAAAGSAAGSATMGALNDSDSTKHAAPPTPPNQCAGPTLPMDPLVTSPSLTPSEIDAGHPSISSSIPSAWTPPVNPIQHVLYPPQLYPLPIPPCESQTTQANPFLNKDSSIPSTTTAPSSFPVSQPPPTAGNPLMMDLWNPSPSFPFTSPDQFPLPAGLRELPPSLNLPSNRDFSNYERGQWALATGNYSQAVEDFGRALATDPINHLSYLERGIAHFGLGEYERSLEDYQQFTSQAPKANPLSVSEFSLGLAKGLPKGVYESGGGLLLFIVDFAKHPIHTSGQIIDSITALVDLVRRDEWGVVAEALSPEVHQLVTQWETLSSEKRGELAGYAVGKHGADILIPGAILKVAGKSAKIAEELTSVYQNLQIAQKTLILETAAGIGNSAKIAEVVRNGQTMTFLGEELGFTAQEMGQLKKLGKLEQAIDGACESWLAKSPSEAYIAAKNGGRHADLIPKFSEKPVKEIEKSIRSYEKLIAEHKDKIANPSKYCQDWDNFHPNRQKALVEKVWPTEIQCYTEQKDILKTILDQRQ